MNRTKRVLSIQSHVCHGFVGNKSATFPLQVLGFDVDALNTVQLSNHTGYPSCKGQVLDQQTMTDIIDGLDENQLLNYDYVLSGFCKSEGSLLGIKTAVERVKAVNPDVIYVLDPVLGDNGSLYVPESLIPLYKAELKMATIITPNHFEASLLTGITVDSVESGRRALVELHNLGVPYVVITSIPIVEEEVVKGVTYRREMLVLLGSTKSGEVFELRFHRIPSHFTGTGDVLAALVLAFFEKSDAGLRKACEKALCILQDILLQSLRYREAHPIGDLSAYSPAVQRSMKMNDAELCLVQSRELIAIGPDGRFKARRLSPL